MQLCRTPSVYCHVISIPLEAFSVPNAPASFLAFVFHYSLYYSNFSIYFSHPPLPTYHYFFFLPFFLYYSYLSLVSYVHKQILTQHKPRERRNHPSQKMSTPRDNHPILAWIAVCSFNPCTTQEHMFSLSLPL